MKTDEDSDANKIIKRGGIRVAPALFRSLRVKTHLPSSSFALLASRFKTSRTLGRTSTYVSD
jgi:hypothetical protein